MESPSSFLCGVVEGFYGRPWNARQRHQLFAWMKTWGMSTYLYAPKDDLKHRLQWREPYGEIDLAEMAALIRDCQRHQLRFVYSISPGMDMRYSSPQDFDFLIQKLSHLGELGCRDFALLFDDIPARMDEVDAKQFRSLAEAHCQIANRVSKFLLERFPGGRVLFCPTPYCDIMAEKQPDYLPTLGLLLDLRIEVLWTGPQVISKEISVASIQKLRRVINRKPILWDNLHANDYDLQQVFLGPYSGRAPELRDEIGGILTNPNCQFEANFIALRTLAMYCCESAAACAPRAAYSAALEEWAPSFQTYNGRREITVEDLRLLGDFFYLPNEVGVVAKAFLQHCETLLHTAPTEWGNDLSEVLRIATQTANLVEKLGTLQNRELLYSIYPFVWALRAELDLLVAYFSWLQPQSVGSEPASRFVSPENGLGIQRGGLLERLRNLTVRTTSPETLHGEIS